MRPGAVTLGRAPIAGSRGAVACGHPVAAEIGIDAMRDGGGAVDATIAAAFASFVVEPQMCGIGGHGRMSIYRAERRVAVAIDHFIRAPAAATPEVYGAALARAGDGGAAAIGVAGPLAVGIPGAIAGLWEAHRRFGTLPWRRLVGPAIELARAGVEVGPRLAPSIAQRAGELRRFPAAAALLLHDGLPPPAAGPGAAPHRLDLADMARTLEAIATSGAAAFYEGALAAAIAHEMQIQGGVLAEFDLAGYRPDVFASPRHRYQRWDYVTGGDLIFVEALNILERFDLGALGADSVAFRHVVAEALAQAFVDNFAHAADPRHVDAPLDGLASKVYAATQAARIDPTRAREAIAPGDPRPHQPGRAAPPPPFEGTTQICAMDSRGDAASLITSLGGAFGSLVLVPGTGVLLGNAMQWFDRRPGRPNSIGPGRMPLYAAPVVLVFDCDVAIGALGGSGGYRIQTAILHALVNRLDHGLAPQAAIDAPRLHSEGGALEVDSRFGDDELAGLARLGHRLRRLDGDRLEGGFGRPSAVWRLPDGQLVPASDARAGGVAAL